MENNSSAITKVMNEIYTLNPDVYENIVKKGSSNNIGYSDLLEIRQKLKLKKVLVNPKMSLKDNTKESGCKAELIRTYNSLMMEDPDEVMGKLTIGGVSVKYDISIVRLVKSLVIIGVTPNEELATACRELIHMILVLGTTSNYVSAKDTVVRLKESTKEFKGIAEELMKGILEVIG